MKSGPASKSLFYFHTTNEVALVPHDRKAQIQTNEAVLMQSVMFIKQKRTEVSKTKTNNNGTAEIAKEKKKKAHK